MSWRIEQSDALTLLRELPDKWAQTCVTSPRRDLHVPYLLAVLDEIHRVLRKDGTLWLALTRGGNSPRLVRSLEETGWLRPPCPSTLPGGHLLGRSPAQLLMFTKQPGFFFNPFRAPAASRPSQMGLCSRHPTAPRPGRAYGHCPSLRRAWCVLSPSAAGVLPREVIEWCILTSTVPRACGVCGTPWQQIPRGRRRDERWRAICAHINDRGRSLVLDPFCGPGSTGIVAQHRGRDFLGVEPNRATAALARRRLTAGQQETVR